MSNSVETSRKVSNSLITFYFAMKLLFFRLLKLISVFFFPFFFLVPVDAVDRRNFGFLKDFYSSLRPYLNFCQFHYLLKDNIQRLLISVVD